MIHKENGTSSRNRSPDSSTAPVSLKDDKAPRASLAARVWTSFQRDPNASITRPELHMAAGQAFDVERAAEATAASPLLRRLKARHLQMIAIGGSIGTGLFVCTVFRYLG